MAALRHAARRLCERALQGAPRLTPARRPLSITSSFHGQPTPATSGPQDELKRQFEKKKLELFDLIEEVENKQVYPTLSWADFQNSRLATQLSAHLEHRPDYFWHSYRTTSRISDLCSMYFLLGYLYMAHYWEPKRKQDGATSYNSTESKILANREHQDNDLNKLHASNI